MRIGIVNAGEAMCEDIRQHHLTASVLIILVFLPVVALAQLQRDGATDHGAKVGSLVDENRTPLGSCFFVDRRGYVATAFSNVEQANGLAVVFHGGQSFPVLGVVAANRGKDIVILALQGTPPNAAPLTIDDAAPLEIGENLMHWAGPLAARPDLPPLRDIQENRGSGSIDRAATLLPKLARKLRGDEYCLGVAELPRHGIGQAPDTRWIWLNAPRRRDCAGGPVFNRAGDVVAMLSGCLEPGPEIFSAIHAKHLTEAIPAGAMRPMGLATLRTWVDPSPLAAVPLDEEESSATLGGRLQRGLPLAARFRDVQRRLTQVEQEEAGASKSHAAAIARNLELAPRIEQVLAEIEAIQPEEQYTTTETRTRHVLERVRSPDRDKGDKATDRYEYRDEEYQVEVTRLRHSARQLQILEPLRLELGDMQAEMLGGKNQLAFDKALEQFLGRVRTRIAAEVFYLADPLGIRSLEEHEAFVVALTETIDEGGAPAIVYAMRAMSQATLRHFEEARVDLAEAEEADTAIRHLTRAIEARCKIRSGQTGPGNKQLAESLAKDKADLRLLMIAARCALDRGDTAGAVNHLTIVQPRCPEPVEIDLGLAWISSTGPSKFRSSLACATEAVRLTAGQDWSAVAALAAARARAKDFVQATAELEAASRLAPEAFGEQFRDWQAQLDRKRPIARDWK